jgi:hypothetical protein
MKNHKKCLVFKKILIFEGNFKPILIHHFLVNSMKNSTAMRFAIAVMLYGSVFAPVAAQQTVKAGKTILSPTATVALAPPPAPANPKEGSAEPTLLYTIQLGAFEDVRQADFEHIRSYSYVYENENTVFIGGFSTPEAAAEVLAKVQNKGYTDAFVTERDLNAAPEHYIVQLITQTAGEPIEWKKLEPLGTLYAWACDNGQVRIVVGLFDDVNDARVLATKVQTKGFKGAFVRKISGNALNPVTAFDKEPAKSLELAAADKKHQTKGVVMPKTVSKNVAKAVVKVAPREVPASYAEDKSGRTKTVLELQQVLKNMGTFNGLMHGVSNDTLEKAYAEALTRHRRLKKYNEVAQLIVGFDGWESARLLLCITRDLNVNAEVPEISPDLLRNLPEKLLTEPKNLTDWVEHVHKKMATFAKLSKRNEQVADAFKTSFFKTQVQLENHYKTKGFKTMDAYHFALSVLKTLTEADLDDF